MLVSAVVPSSLSGARCPRANRISGRRACPTINHYGLKVHSLED